MSETEPSAPNPRLSRDTWLLIGALTLLGLGVALTFFFSPGSNVNVPPPTGSPLARPPTQGAAYPEATTPAGGVVPTPPAYPVATTPTVDLALTQTSVVLETTALAATVRAEATQTETAVPAYPVPEGTPPTLPTIIPTATLPPPTIPPLPTAPPPPTLPPPPTPTSADLIIDDSPTNPPPPTATPLPTSTPLPTPVPALVLRGSTRWTSDQGPIVLNRDVQLPPGSELIIEPGVEVR
ncbi:MAG: hypothetical protein J7464_13225, partial [Chloroflexus sp.]|nr:hypothetical protein [Chloroflexus sp.]